MKSRTLAWFTVMTLFAALALSVRPAAQDNRRDVSYKHHRYKLVDTGTLGGAGSSLGFEGERDINNPGAVVSLADTTIPDRLCPTFPNCFVAHAVVWRHGVLSDLGALSSGYDSGPIWISDSGLVAGFSLNGLIDPLTTSPEFQAVLFKDGNVIDLGTLGGNESSAFGVSNRGQVVGCAANAMSDSFRFCFGVPQQSRAFLWQGAGMIDLGTLGGPDALAELVNDRGQVAGWSLTDSTVNPTTGIPTQHPFLWEDGKMRDLGTIGGTALAFQGAQGVNHFNNQGEMVGGMNVAGDQAFHPYLWDGRSLHDLGTLGGDFGIATWINESGDVVGWANTGGNQVSHAFLWRKGMLNDLGTVDGDPNSIAFSINSEDQVVGASQDNNLTNVHAFLWERGSIADLNELIVPADASVQLNAAAGLNERGEIVAQGTLSSGDQHAFLLIPCDANHPGIEGCDYTLADGNATADVTHEINIGSPISNSPAAIFARRSLIQSEMPGGPQERMTPQFRNSSVARLSAPHNLTASPLNTYQIRINWQEALGQNQTGFNIYRCHGCPSPRTEGTKIASVGPSVLSYTNGSSTSPLTETTSYTYQVTAFNGSGESAPSNTSSAITGTEPAPTNLSSFAFTRGGIDDIVDLHWTNNATDDNSYFLESCSGPTCTNFSVVAELPANTTSDMQFFQFFPDITFRYRVRAHSPGGFSAYSNIRNQALP